METKDLLLGDFDGLGDLEVKYFSISLERRLDSCDLSEERLWMQLVSTRSIEYEQQSKVILENKRKERVL